MRTPQPINLADKFASFADQWNPRIVAELNGQYVKLVKFRGPFLWHHHAAEDELFLVVKGSMQMGLRDNDGGDERWVAVGPGEMIVIPRGVEHCPRADDDEEAHVLLFEPAGTLNTGNAEHDPRTRRTLEQI